MLIKQRIVAEVSRNWEGIITDMNKPLLCRQFEEVIAANAAKGFVLESWHLNATPVVVDGTTVSINETIIAVFAKGAGL